MNDDDRPNVPPAPAPGAQGSLQRARREDGARQTVSEPVVFRKDELQVDGWALNMSPGGLRAIVERPLEVGLVFQIAVGDSKPDRTGKIVWLQEEKDGAIVGVAFLDVERPSAPPPPDGD